MKGSKPIMYRVLLLDNDLPNMPEKFLSYSLEHPFVNESLNFKEF